MDFRKCVRNCLNPSHSNAIRGNLQDDYEREEMANHTKQMTRWYR